MERLRGGLVVSCQAYPGEPMRHTDTMTRVARAVADGGAAGIRAQGLEDIRAIRAAVNLPLVGLWKDSDHPDKVVITPTLRHALDVARAGADIVAIDATTRTRPDGRTLADTIQAIHEETGALVMADLSTHDEGVRAEEAGADMVATTMSGYTAHAPQRSGPDLELVARLTSTLAVPVVAEGRIHTPNQVTTALAAGAHAVVVGTAITHPTTLTRWFVDATRGYSPDCSDHHRQ